jgi:hypothetical protein
MAVIVVGAHGARWIAADWIARNAFDFLRPALESCGLVSAAQRLVVEDDVPAAFADLSDLLENHGRSAAWERAVGGALAAIDAEAGAGWLEPQRFGEFRTAVAALAELAVSEGNALVVRLAERTAKILDGPP